MMVSKKEEFKDFGVVPKKNKIYEITVIVIMILTFVVAVSTTDWGKETINSLVKPQYDLLLIDEGQFNYNNISPLFVKEYISVHQEISFKTSEDNAIFSFKIDNSGENKLENYSIHILIIDPLNNIRANEEIGNVEEDKFKVKFNFPPEEEKLYGEWKIYSGIEKYQKTYSKIILPVNVEPPKNEFVEYVIAIMMVLLMSFFSFYGKIKSLFKSKK
jgi:hypothetical protein